MQNSTQIERSSSELEIIEFYIQEQLDSDVEYCGYYGLNVSKVIEIIRRPKITTVPSKHDKAVLGTFNLRGKVMPLIDLSIWLGKTMIINDAEKVIVSEFSGTVVAFLVSGVTRIHRLSWADVEMPSKHVHAYSRESITGVLRIENRILFILDMEKIVGSMDNSFDMSEAHKNIAPVEDASLFNILIVDDSVSLRNMIKFTLEYAGYNVTAKATGMEAWEYLEKVRLEAEKEGVAITEKIHVVVSDIEMPQMDGHSLVRKIRATPALSGLPVVLFSSLITAAEHIKGVESGADEQITKPDLPSLTGKVRELISRKLGM